VESPVVMTVIRAASEPKKQMMAFSRSADTVLKY
jgi:hypothetical protein